MQSSANKQKLLSASSPGSASVGQTDAHEKGSGKAQRVEALARGLQVLSCFEPGVISLGHQEITDKTGLPKSTVSRLLSTLVGMGYLRYQPSDGRYAPGYAILSLGFGCLASLEVRDLARPILDNIAQKTGAAIAIGAFDGQYMVYLDAVHGSSMLYLRLAVGHRVSFNSAMGRAYLATLSIEEQKHLLQQVDAPQVWHEQMEQVRRDFEETGCCYSLGEWQPGINSVATPIYTPSGEGPFVISCGAPETLLSQEQIKTEVTAMLKAEVAPLALAG